MKQRLETQSTRTRKRIVTLMAVLLVVFVAGFLFMRLGLDKAMVQKKLDEYIAILKDKGHKSGRDIDVSYGDLEVTGGISNRHVLVHDLVITVKPEDGRKLAAKPKNNAVMIKTDALEFYPRSMNLSRFMVALPHPISVVDADQPEKSLLTVSSDVPLAVTVSKATHGATEFVHVEHTVPTAIDMTYLREQQTQGEEDQTPALVPVYDTIHTTVAAPSSAVMEFATDESGLGYADVSVKQLSMTPKSAPEGGMAVAGAELHWKSALNDMGTNVMENQLTIGPITATNNWLPYAPIRVALDLAYEGASGVAADAAGGAAKKASLTLRKFELSTKDSTLAATANFESTPTDIMPTGKAHVTLTNLPYVQGELRKYGLLTEESEPWVGELMQKITGTPFAELKDLDIPIERQPGGAFKLGNSTFEEVVAVVLKHALHIAPPAEPGAGEGTHAPQLPPADKPKSKPIAVPDTGARG